MTTMTMTTWQWTLWERMTVMTATLVQLVVMQQVWEATPPAATAAMGTTRTGLQVPRSMPTTAMMTSWMRRTRRTTRKRD
ncbi:MAG: hypothetical protein J3R72DRAFT_441815 [Linnemannia gamsii]|nr:MAG: hypothetical protein J3R72DRAFT_441815 [Linnemannia gamsii]